MVRDYKASVLYPLIGLTVFVIFSHRSDSVAVDSSITRMETLRVMLAETARGNVFAFSCLYDELGTETYTLGLRILGNRGQADRAAMEIWLWVWQNAASLTRVRDPAREAILTVAFNVSMWCGRNE